MNYSFDFPSIAFDFQVKIFFLILTFKVDFELFSSITILGMYFFQAIMTFAELLSLVLNAFTNFQELVPSCSSFFEAYIKELV
jgi:hypothetical protein